jgi:hypothetical protein
MFLTTTAAYTKTLKYLLQLACLKKYFSFVKIFKPNWFVFLLFSLPEGSQVSTAPRFHQLENRFL